MQASIRRCFEPFSGSVAVLDMSNRTTGRLPASRDLYGREVMPNVIPDTHVDRSKPVG